MERDNNLECAKNLQTTTQTLVVGSSKTVNSTKDKLVLIDGNSLINRAFYALPLLKNSDGEFCNAVYGFCNILIKLIIEQSPKYMAVAFDMGQPTFRHKKYADYKAGRKKMPDELASQLPILKNVLKAMNICFVEKPGIEADDLVGSLSKSFDVQTIIVSGDRDLFQLVDDNTSVWFTKKGVSDAIIVTPNNIKDVYGVSANQVVDLKALMGDSSDNIKGVAGIGEKTALKLINTYGSLKNIYQNIDSTPVAIKKKLLQDKDSAELSQWLATIKTDVDLQLSLDNLKFDFPFKKEVYDLFNKYEFWSILKHAEYFDSSEVAQTKKVVKQNYITTIDDVYALAKNLQTTQVFGFDFDDELHFANSKFEENIIKFDQNDLKIDKVLPIFAPILQNDKILKCVLNSKSLMHKLAEFGIELKGVQLDANIALYLLSGSDKTNFTKSTFAEKYDYDAGCIAVSLLVGRDLLFESLKAENMMDLYCNVELPLSPVLFDMEQNGFKVDTKVLEVLGCDYKAELENLTQKIYQDAGQVFNIKSPKQVAEILFDKLAIKLGKREKKSTGVEVLERLVGIHPIVEKILRYRKLEKLYSTYIEPFKKMTDSQSLIHTIFNQTLTSTGRLSSSEPNLQNIPIRDEEGKNLRKMFVSRFDGGQIVTSDYSQIELRLVAHYSGDPKLQYAYHNGIDIHAQTASDIFEVPLSQVTPKMRRDAKAVNFGIIYGISEFGLAKDIGISTAEAKRFIEKYFDTYKGVKNYVDGSVNQAKQLGYATTLFGRKRNIEELKSNNYMIRQFGERVARNMPLQGTASDIIKIAMINVYKQFKAQNLKSKLILQIHDELIVDATADEVEIVKKILKQQMEGAVKLSVPLTVDVESGKTWFEAK
jgi:DNA polymerase-1